MKQALHLEALADRALPDRPPRKKTLPGKPPPARVAFYDRFAKDVAFFFDPLPGPRADPAHLFALGYQTRRAFDYIFRHILGASLPIARLRAALWESCFTAFVRAYREELYATMDKRATLIIGETGTGKELAAQAIAQSRYVPFDQSTKFSTPASGSCTAVEPLWCGRRRVPT